MNLINKNFICALGISLLPTFSQASVINFDFTGRLVVTDATGTGIVGPAYTPIAASLEFDTVSGIGSSDMSITMNDFYLSAPATFHDISMTRQADSNFIDGTILVDWNGTYNMELSVQWDATGLFNAINYGLQAGDVLSGTDLYHDTNNTGLYDTGDTYLANIGSTTPYSDSLQLDPLGMQGPAPMAATINSEGFVSGPFIGIKGLFDIGSGNSMHVTSVSAVPVPAAVWLFGSGLLGLIAIAKRKAA